MRNKDKLNLLFITQFFWNCIQSGVCSIRWILNVLFRVGVYAAIVMLWEGAHELAQNSTNLAHTRATVIWAGSANAAFQMGWQQQQRWWHFLTSLNLNNLHLLNQHLVPSTKRSKGYSATIHTSHLRCEFDTFNLSQCYTELLHCVVSTEGFYIMSSPSKQLLRPRPPLLRKATKLFHPSVINSNNYLTAPKCHESKHL